jgi:hypothetical protein
MISGRFHERHAVNTKHVAAEIPERLFVLQLTPDPFGGVLRTKKKGHSFLPQ